MHINTEALFGLIWMIVWFLFIFLIIRGIWRAIKKFTFEIIDHTKGTTPQTDASKAKYTAEARKACEKVTPKRRRDETPPWEQ